MEPRCVRLQLPCDAGVAAKRLGRARAEAPYMAQVLMTKGSQRPVVAGLKRCRMRGRGHSQLLQVLCVHSDWRQLEQADVVGCV